MRGFGQIAELCEIARPDIGVITAVGPVHLELVGSVDGVARSKAELVAALPEGGIAVVPRSADLDPHLRDDIEIRRVGPVDVELRDDGAHVAFGGGRIRFPLTSRHQAQNALTALTAYDALGLPLDRLAESAAAVQLSPWRGEELALAGRRLRRQRRLQREPDLDGGGAAPPRRARRRPAPPRDPRRHGGARRARGAAPPRDRGARGRARHRGDRGRRARDARTRPRRGSRTPRPHSPRPATSSAPETPCSSRRPARSRSKASPPTWRTFPRSVPSLHSGPDRDGHLGRDRPEVHRVPAPERARPADPRGRPGRPRRQAGDARDGRPADPPLCTAALPRALPLHAAGADRPLHDRQLRRDRLPRRLHQAPPPPLAGTSGRWKLLLLAGDHRRRGIRRARADPARHLDLRAGRERRHPALVRLLPVPLPHHRGRGERREPHRWPGRARRRDRDHRAPHLPRDHRDRLRPLR